MAGRDILGDFGKMLGVESNNRQHNRDGSVVRSPKGATGIAQVMPSTGPEAARLAGVAWDATRFESDKDYNASLGKAYYDAQLDRFGGDRRAAQAAYNAGPNRVDRLRKQYGKDWEAHLPAETNDYLAKINGVVSSPMRTIDPDVLAETPSGSGTPSPELFDPFNAAPGVQKAGNAMLAADQNAMDTLESASQQLNQIQDQRVQLAQEAIASKNAVFSDIEAGTEALREKVKPIFAARSELATRRLELEKMNPIKREILGIFNRNYSPEHIEKLDQAYAGQAEEAGREFEVTNQLNNTMLSVISGRVSGEDALQQLLAQNVGEDMQLAQNSVSLTAKKFGDTLSMITAGTQLTQAQILARNETVSQLTPGDVNTYLAQARKNGGSVTINGVPVSSAELMDRTRQYEQQRLSLESMQLGLQNQRQNVADESESRLISHMSSADIQGAIKNGGVFNGQQLDQVKLTSALNSSMQRQGLLASQAANSLDSQTFVGAVDSYKHNSTMQIARIAAITGNQMPAEFRGFSQRFIQVSQEYQQRFANAPEEMKPILRKEFVQVLGKLQEQSDGAIDKVAQGMTRDPDGQILLGAWMKGNTVSAEQTVKGIMALGRGGALPPGVRFSGPAGSAIKAGVAAAQSVDARYDPSSPENRALAARGQTVTKPDAKSLAVERLTAVTKAVQAQWVGGNVNQLMQQLPAAAAQAKDPFGSVSPSDYRAAQAAGDRQAMDALSQKLGWTVEQTNSVFGRERNKRPSDFKMDDSQAAEARKFLATQSHVEMLRALDTSPSGQAMAAHGMKASEAMVNFMRSDGMQQRLATMEQTISRGSFGNMVADSISQGGVGELFNRNANMLAQAQGAIHEADTQSIRDRSAHYAGNPVKRLGVILGAVPGLNEAEEQRLLMAVRDAAGYGTMNRVLNEMPIIGTTTGSDGVNEKFDSIILNHKFDDPALEKIRQRAAKDWVMMSGASDRAVARLQKQ